MWVGNAALEAHFNLNVMEKLKPIPFASVQEATYTLSGLLQATEDLFT